MDRLLHVPASLLDPGFAKLWEGEVIAARLKFACKTALSVLQTAEEIIEGGHCSRITAGFCSKPEQSDGPRQRLNMSSAIAGKTVAPCRSTVARRVRPGRAFFSGAPVAAKLRSHGVGTRKVTSMNVRVLTVNRPF